MKAKIRRFIDVFRYCFKLKPRMIFSGIFSAIANWIKPFILLIVSKHLIEAVLAGTNYHALLNQIIMMLIIYFFLSVGGGYLEKRHQYQVKNFLRQHDFEKACHLLSIAYKWTESDDMQERMADIQNFERRNIFSFRSFFTHLNKACGSLLGLIIALMLVSGIFRGNSLFGSFPEWWFSLGFGILFMLAFWLTLRINAKINQQFGVVLGEGCSPILRYLKAYSTLLYQYKSGKDVRLYNKDLAMRYSQKYCEFSERVYTMFSDLFTKSISLETLMLSLSNGLIYAFIALKAVYGSIRISEIVLYIGAFSQLTLLAMELIDSLSMLYAGDLFREKILDFYSIGEEETVKKRQAQIGLPIEMSMDVRFEHVSFGYPGSSKNVLNDVSFTAHPGEKLAIVGENGSGKTTLIKLLLGLYQDYEGKIYIGGRKAEDLTENDYCNLFAPVFQDFKLLAVNLQDNICCFGKATEKQLDCILNQVDLGEFYQKHGLKVCLTRAFDRSGIEISGGEAQKIAMARAIFKRSHFYILDEPTAALDPISEREIYEQFNEIIQGQTTLFISHRLSSCKFCDRIIVMDQGQIVQCGSHEQLLSDPDGKYYALWNAQAQHYIRGNCSIN